jgi:hypothetical protein
MSGAEMRNSIHSGLSERSDYLIVTAFPDSHMDFVRDTLVRAGAELETLPLAGQGLPARRSAAPTVLAVNSQAGSDAAANWLNAEPAMRCLCVT